MFLLVAINTKYIHSNPSVYSLKAYANKVNNTGDSIVIAEYTINQLKEDIIADIYSKHPDAVGFSSYIWNITYIKNIICELTKLLPETHIWLGGPEVSYDAEDTLLTMPGVKGIMIGEGEETFSELALLYYEACCDSKTVSDSKLGNIAGITYRKDNGNIIIGSQRELTDLSSLPFLYSDLSKFENKIIYYETSRGCPFRCSYCLSSIDKTVRLRSMDVVVKELQYFLDNKVKQVKFVDRTFNCNKAHAMAIWQYIFDHDNGVTNFHFEIEANLIDEDEARLLSKFRPGAVQLEIGVQTTNVDTLKEINRETNIEGLRKSVGIIRDAHNIHIHLDLIAGLPFEGYHSFAKSFDDVYSMGPEQLQLGFLKLLKGSKMHDMAEDYGIVATSEPPYEVLYTRWISYEEIRKLKAIEEMVETYYNSNQFTVTLPLAMRAYTSPFAFFEKLAKFYKEKGYFEKSPSRIHRYDVLLEYLETDDNQEKDSIELYKESLTVDLYFREYLKSRPEFAIDIKAHKEAIRDILSKESAEHKILGDDYIGLDSKMLGRSVWVEPVHYDFKTGSRLKKTSYIIFDYKNRNPLTGDGKVVIL